jgi:hypothetical protein
MRRIGGRDEGSRVAEAPEVRGDDVADILVVLVLVKVQLRSTQEAAKFAVGAVLPGAGAGANEPPPPPPPHADNPKADNTHTARSQLHISHPFRTPNGTIAAL